MRAAEDASWNAAEWQRMPQIEGPFPVHLIKIKEFKNVINDDDVCDPYVQLTLGKESQTSDVKVDAGGEVEFNQVSPFQERARCSQHY